MDVKIIIVNRKKTTILLNILKTKAATFAVHTPARAFMLSTNGDNNATIFQNVRSIPQRKTRVFTVSIAVKSAEPVAMAPA